MFTAIHFKNFRVLKDSTLPLGRCTLIVGPNGSGKSTALSAIELIPGNEATALAAKRSATCDVDARVELRFDWSNDADLSLILAYDHQPHVEVIPDGTHPKVFRQLSRDARIFRFEARAIAEPAAVQNHLLIDRTGRGLAAVLDRIKDRHDENWVALNRELAEWFPEFDRIRLDVVDVGDGRQKSFSLALKGQLEREIPANDLSDGVLLSVAMLTLAHLPHPPALIGLEEPDRGIHPRLLRDVFHALMRLSHPEEFGDSREPVQIVVTTHSPYLLDFFRDRPEEVVVANRVADNVQFGRLADQPYIREIVGDSSLGDAWYTGVLGGVPTS